MINTDDISCNCEIVCVVKRSTGENQRANCARRQNHGTVCFDATTKIRNPMNL